MRNVEEQKTMVKVSLSTLVKHQTYIHTHSHDDGELPTRLSILNLNTMYKSKINKNRLERDGEQQGFD